MLNVDNLKQALDLIPLSPEIKESMLKNTEILVEFRQFLATKYNISEADAEKKITEDLSKLYKLELNPKIEEVTEIVKSYANDQGFEKSEELKESILNLQKSLSF